MKTLLKFYSSKCLYFSFAVVTVCGGSVVVGGLIGQLVNLFIPHNGNSAWALLTLLIGALVSGIFMAMGDGNPRRWFRLRLGKEYRVYQRERIEGVQLALLGNSGFYRQYRFPRPLPIEVHVGTTIVLLHKVSDLTVGQRNRGIVPVALECFYPSTRASETTVFQGI